MCMKNLNTDVVFFQGVDVPLESQDGIINIRDVYKEYPTISASHLDKETLEIKTLSFMLSVNAIERTQQPVHDPEDTPDNTVFFSEKYELCFRLTEPKSGKFVDLDTYSFTPEEDKITLCRKIFSKKISCHYRKIRVALPPEGKSFCVLKVLIRRYHTSPNWIVQSIHPIRLVFDGDDGQNE